MIPIHEHNHKMNFNGDNEHDGVTNLIHFYPHFQTPPNWQRTLSPQHLLLVCHLFLHAKHLPVIGQNKWLKWDTWCVDMYKSLQPLQVCQIFLYIYNRILQTISGVWTHGGNATTNMGMSTSISHEVDNMESFLNKWDPSQQWGVYAIAEGMVEQPIETI